MSESTTNHPDGESNHENPKRIMLFSLLPVCLFLLLLMSASNAPLASASSDVWNWENPLPQGNTLSGVSCWAGGGCYAVGAGGTILSWDGVSWHAGTYGTTDDLYGVSCTSASACKAVGASGTIVSWDGASWSADASGTSYPLYGVSCASASACKAVGASGTIVSWNGASWSADVSGTPNALNGVSCTSTSTCSKAVGSYGTILGTSAPAAVTLASFTADVTGGKVTLAWETASEVDVLGFNLYRADTSGAWARLNAAMLPSQAPGSPGGYSYTYDDRTAVRGGIYHYRLAAVKLNGQETALETVQAAVPYWLWLPVIK